MSPDAKRATLLTLAVALVSIGGLVIWMSLRTEPPVAALRPSETYVVAEPTPDPVTAAPVEPIPDDSSSSAPADPVGQMDPDDMGPDRLYVPALRIYASLAPVRFSGGRLTVPDQPWRVGIDTESAGLSAGEGTTLLAGHVDLGGTPGALSPLAQMPVGARIYVTDEQGRRSDFVVSSLQQYSKVALPREIFATDGTRQLALVTCGGPVISDGMERHYRDNVVVTAVPV